MPGPIIRSGPTTKYQQNWDSAFSDKPSKKARAEGADSKKAAKKKKK